MTSQPANNGSAVIASAVLHRAVVIAVADAPAPVIDISQDAANIAASLRSLRFHSSVVGAIADGSTVYITHNTSDAIIRIDHIDSSEIHTLGYGAAIGGAANHSAYMRGLAASIVNIHI